MNAKLWEDTVVTAIRDEKWLHALRHQLEVPLPQVKLKGNAEQRLGDLLDVANDRFFLFEVKGTREDIKDEWSTKNEEKYHQKDAYRAHYFWTNNLSDPASEPNMQRSLLAHFFAYWVEFSTPDEKMIAPPNQRTWRDFLTIGECVAIEPYALACRSFLDKQPDDAKFGKFNSNLRVGIQDADQNEFVCRQQIPLSLVYEGLGYLIEEDQTPPIPTATHWSLLGLKLDKFKKYISTLCSFVGNSAEPIHAIVMSSSGSFFRVVTTTMELQDLLGSSPKVNLEKTPWPEHRSPKMTAEEKEALRAKRAQEQANDEADDQGPTPWRHTPP